MKLEDSGMQFEKIGKVTKDFPFKFNFLTRIWDNHESITDNDRLIIRKEEGEWTVYKLFDGNEK